MKKVLIVLGIALVFACAFLIPGPDVDKINQESYDAVYEQVYEKRGAYDFELKPNVIVDGIVDSYLIVVDGEIVGYFELNS